MALKVKDRVKETSTTSGLGPIVVAGSAAGFQTFGSTLNSGDTTYYGIVEKSGPDWEVGIGTYITSNNSLLRTTILASSNNNNAVSLSSNVKDVFITYPAERVLEVAYGGTGAVDSVAARTNLGLEIGVDIQAWDADLDAISALAGTSGLLHKTAANTWELDTSVYLTAETDTLETVVARGGTTANAIQITNATDAVAANNGGALTVSGGAGIGKQLYVGSNATVGGNLRIDGDFSVGGTSTTLNTRNITISDNMLYLNEALSANVTYAEANGTSIIYTANNTFYPGGIVRVTGITPAAFNIDWTTITYANSTVFIVNSANTGSYSSGGTAREKVSINPDLGFSGGYNDGTYHHAGLFRDASDGVWKFFHNYVPEPDANVFIDTADVSFALAPVSAGSFIGSVFGNANTATVLNTARAINGVNFNGSSAITISANTFNTLTFGGGFNTAAFNGSSPVTITANSASTTQAGIVQLNDTVISTSTTTAATANSVKTVYDYAVGVAGGLTSTNSLVGVVYGQANTAITNAATALGVAQSAFSTANSKFSSSGGAISGSVSISQDLTVSGNVAVKGTVTSIDSVTVKVADRNIELANVASPTNTTADGGGITVLGATNKTFNWLNSTTAWTSSEHLDLATGKSYYIAGSPVLSGTTLGSGVTASSLTSVGVVTSGTWSGSFGAVSGSNLINLTAANLTGTIPAAILGNSTVYIGSTSIELNRGSAALSLTGVSIDGNAGTVSNGVYTTGTYANPNWITLLAASKLSGTIPAAVLGNSTVYIGTTAVALNRATGSQGLTGISSIALPGSSSGTITIQPTAIAGTTTITFPANTGTVITSGDVGTVTNPMLGGGITNNKLANTSVTVTAGTGLSGGGTVTLGGTAITLTANTGSTTLAGILQLTDSVSSTSTTTAATPNSVKTAYDLAVTANTNASNASVLTIGTVGAARLGSGTANSTTYLRGDSTWATISSGGVTVSDDTVTNSSYYPVLATATSGSMSAAKVSSTKFYFNPSTGTLNSTVFNSLSDASKKTSVVKIKNAVETVSKIEGVEFDWIDTGYKSAGVIAQQLETILPHLVNTDREGLKSVNYDGIIGYLIASVKELSSKIEQMENK